MMRAPASEIDEIAVERMMRGDGPTPRRGDPDVVEAMVRLLASRRLSCGEIACRVQVSTRTVGRVAAAMRDGFEQRPADPLRDPVLALLADGASMREVRRRFGIGYHRIRKLAAFSSFDSELETHAC
jgi:transposase